MLATILSKVLLVCAYVFANWKVFAGALTYMTGSAYWPTVLFGCSLSGGVIVLFSHFIARLFLRFIKINTVPETEFCFFATLAWTLYCLILGLLNLVYLFAPTFVTWGTAIFPVVATLLSGLAFYVVTSKLYFNNATKAYYFKMLSIAIIVLAVMAGGAL